jgi:hypothetical protein
MSVEGCVFIVDTPFVIWENSNLNPNFTFSGCSFSVDYPSPAIIVNCSQRVTGILLMISSRICPTYSMSQTPTQSLITSPIPSVLFVVSHTFDHSDELLSSVDLTKSQIEMISLFLHSAPLRISDGIVSDSSGTFNPERTSAVGSGATSGSSVVPIVGGVFGCFALIGAICVVVCLLKRGRSQNRDDDSSSGPNVQFVNETVSGTSDGTLVSSQDSMMFEGSSSVLSPSWPTGGRGTLDMVLL